MKLACIRTPTQYLLEAPVIGMGCAGSFCVLLLLACAPRIAAAHKSWNVEARAILARSCASKSA